jgi:hypothetical protein
LRSWIASSQLSVIEVGAEESADLEQLV